MPKELKQADVKDALDFFTEEAVPKRTIGRPFAKGESGNPSGKPQEAEGLDANLTLALGRAGARRLARKLIDIALDGSGHVQFSAIQYIYDRLEGRPRQSQNDTKDAEDPLALLLRNLINDRSALEGRTYPALRPGAVVEGQVREVPSEDARA